MDVQDVETKLSFGAKLRAIRERRKLSQQQVADRTRRSKSNISRLENNPSQRPSESLVLALSKALDWPLNDARVSAGYSPVEGEWPRDAQAVELLPFVEQYRKLPETTRLFLREQIEGWVEFLKAGEPKSMTAGSGRKYPFKEDTAEVVPDDELPENVKKYKKRGKARNPREK